ncbi:MAG: hypothetical protein ACP5UF_02545 [Hydrogenobaculum sp.]
MSIKAKLWIIKIFMILGAFVAQGILYILDNNIKQNIDAYKRFDMLIKANAFPILEKMVYIKNHIDPITKYIFFAIMSVVAFLVIFNYFVDKSIQNDVENLEKLIKETTDKMELNVSFDTKKFKDKIQIIAKSLAIFIDGVNKAISGIKEVFYNISDRDLTKKIDLKSKGDVKDLIEKDLIEFVNIFMDKLKEAFIAEGIKTAAEQMENLAKQYKNILYISGLSAEISNKMANATEEQAQTIKEMANVSANLVNTLKSLRYRLCLTF